MCGKILISDIVVWADTFLFKKGSTINRMKIKTIDGGRWLTVPALTHGLAAQQIRKVRIDNHALWAKNHLRALQNNYCNSPYYFYYIDELLKIFNSRWDMLAELLEYSMQFYRGKMPVKAEFIKSSKLPGVSDRTDRVLAWLNETGCDTFLFEPFEQKLFDQEKVRAKDFSLKLYDFRPVKYHQQFAGFVDSLSALDLLFNEGEMSASILKRSIVLDQF
ncbi:MAG: WbqC family protein [Calditrichaeota bacterium]|nr:WbqC family protein [Calditrichota bacterium]